MNPQGRGATMVPPAGLRWTVLSAPLGATVPPGEAGALALVPSAPPPAGFGFTAGAVGAIPPGWVGAVVGTPVTPLPAGLGVTV